MLLVGQLVGCQNFFWDWKTRVVQSHRAYKRGGLVIKEWRGQISLFWRLWQGYVSERHRSNCQQLPSPPPPLISNCQHLLDPPSPPRQSSSSFGQTHLNKCIQEKTLFYATLKGLLIVLGRKTCFVAKLAWVSTQKKIWDYSGIFPNMGGGSSQFPLQNTKQKVHLNYPKITQKTNNIFQKITPNFFFERGVLKRGGWGVQRLGKIPK